VAHALIETVQSCKRLKKSRMAEEPGYRFRGQAIESGHGEFQVVFAGVLNLVVADAT
jgi:hypothetical protein